MAGKVMIGVSLTVRAETWEKTLSEAGTLPAADYVQRVVGTTGELQFWFRGPRLLGDFLMQWCQNDDRRSLVRLQLAPSEQYVAVVADDILAVQELHTVTWQAQEWTRSLYA